MCGFEYPVALEDRRISNPDAFEQLHTLTLQSGSETVEAMPVIQSLLPLSEVIHLPNFFDAVDIVLLSVDAGPGVTIFSIAENRRLSTGCERRTTGATEDQLR